MRAFYRDHRCQTPLFPEIAREFLRFLEARAIRRTPRRPPFLRELAHYEWVELALQIAAAREDCRRTIRKATCSTACRCCRRWPGRWPIAGRCTGSARNSSPTDAARRADPAAACAAKPTAGALFQLSPLAFRLLQRLGERPT